MMINNVQKGRFSQKVLRFDTIFFGLKLRKMKIGLQTLYTNLSEPKFDGQKSGRLKIMSNRSTFCDFCHIINQKVNRRAILEQKPAKMDHQIQMDHHWTTIIFKWWSKHRLWYHYTFNPMDL